MKNKTIENENKVKIYRVAEQLFFEKGYIDTSVDEIIKRSNTSKGTFYHYFKNKADLGLSVFEASHLQHNEICELFPDTDSLVLLALEIRIFWFAYFNDENFRRFFNDLNRESVYYESKLVIKFCLEHTRKSFDDNELDLILASIQGLRRQISLHVYDKTDMHTFDQVSTFSLRQFFRLFEISNNCIQETIKSATLLFDQLEIKLDKFYFNVTVRLQ
ncbi:MAG: TetR/AcrR family transcriptional regulator [Eubacteriales bacterium]